MVCRWDGVGVEKWGDECSVSGGGGGCGKIYVLTFSNIFLKTLTEGAVTTEAGSSFQYFTTLAEMPTSSLTNLDKWMVVTDSSGKKYNL